MFTAADTLVAGDAKAQLERALDNILDADPPELFDKRFQVLAEREGGSQGVVSFARDVRGGMMQFAIKCASLCRLRG